MKNNTQEKILTYIKQGGKTANTVITKFNLNATGVFRHLKKLQELGLIYKVGKPPKVTYYTHTNNMITISSLTKNISNWSVSNDVNILPPEILCSTRDIFQARTDRLLKDLVKTRGEQVAYLLLAIIGEIGFNSYDHNLGNWRDSMGVAFGVDFEAHEAILADRGQGIRATISRVRPQISSDKEALTVAFTEMISGRYPEQRGNGLKYVKKVIMENNLHFKFYSGDACCTISSNGISVEKTDQTIPGTLAIIKF